MNAKRAKLVVSLIPVCIFGLSQSVPAQSRSQHFVCNVGYSNSECQAKQEVLRASLRKYPTEGLGDWTWVIVRSNDWKRLLADRKLAPEIPALTYLPERETFFDEALLENASTRGVELALSWRMTVPELLDLAIRHEMGHALCQERDEAAAKRTAELLRNTPSMSLRACHPKPAALGASSEENWVIAEMNGSATPSQSSDRAPTTKMNRKSGEPGKPLY